MRGQMGVRVRVSERRGNSSGAVLSLALAVCVLHLLLLLTPLLAEFFEFYILQKFISIRVHYMDNCSRGGKENKREYKDQ